MTYIVKGRARLDLKGHWRYIARDKVVIVRVLHGMRDLPRLFISVRA